MDKTTPAAVDLPAPAGRNPTLELAWSDAGDAVELTIPPPPLWRRLVMPGLLLAGATLLAAGPLLLGLALPTDPSGWPMVVVLAGVCTGLWLMVLLAFLRRLRHARRPTRIRVASDAFSIDLPGAPAEERLEWPRGQITDLRLFATGAAPIIPEYLWIKVTPSAGPTGMIQVPWLMPGDKGVVSEIEQRLRAALRFAPPPAPA